jgi:serine/threonine protein kinase
MVIERLKKKHYKVNGGTKYFINCSGIEKETDSVVPVEILKNMHDISIVKAIINYSKHTKKNKKIVIKIAHESKTNRKEYTISERLSKINGFIKYVCLLQCLDDTYEQILHTKQLPEKICTAEASYENDKLVLISPYIQGGSVAKYNWNMQNTDILKTLLKQSIISLMEAYMKHGFLHNDLHLDNILLKHTKMEKVQYDNSIEIETHGYKVVIMDFDSSFIDVNRDIGIEYYWNNLGNLMSRLTYDLSNKIIPIKSDDKISDFIRKAKINKYEANDTISLLELIDQLEFKIATPISLPTYNPYLL